MNSLSKIAFAAILGLVQGQAVEDKFRELSAHDEGRDLKGVFDKDSDAWYLGSCVVKDADGNKKGVVRFHQELTDEGENEPTSVSARVSGAGADRVSIGIYETDPNNLTADDQMANLGEFRPNARNVVSVFGLYLDDVTLNGPDTIEGLFIGFRCVDSGTLVGSCPLRVRERG